MTGARRALRQALTIARRDLVATVFTPIFLLFLFAPVIMGSFGAIGGLSAASVADGGRDKSRLVLIARDADRAAIVAADRQLRAIFRDGEAPPGLLAVAAGGDPVAQAHAAFAAKAYDATAVLYGPLDRPTILYGTGGERPPRYLVTLAGAALARERLGSAAPRVQASISAYRRTARSIGGGHQSAFFAVFGIFFLTLFLSGQAAGTMAEERNNKVIEVLAAAVPLEAVFLGKLLGMFGVAVLFVAFWATVMGQIGGLMPAAMRAGLGELSPAVGGPMFAFLFCAYFTMAYLLLGSVFLGIGAQASSTREIQMLSLPITIVQMTMFALASAAVSRPGSWVAHVAEIFPLSSPFAMAGRAASQPELWPHAAALGWQALWVALCILVSARLFRRGVLQSGSARPRRRLGKSIDIGVS